MMLIDDSEWSLKFLDLWWNDYPRASHSDQAAFTYLYRADALNLQSHSRLVPPHLMNSEFDAWNKLQDHHNILHLAGAQDLLRAAIFREAREQYCRGNEHLQLGLRRERIQQIRYQKAKDVAKCALAVLNISDADKIDCDLLGEFKIWSVSSNFATARQMLQVSIQMGFGAYKGDNANDADILAPMGCSSENDSDCGILVQQRLYLNRAFIAIYNSSFQSFHNHMAEFIQFSHNNVASFADMKNLVPVIQTAIETGFELLQAVIEAESIPGYMFLGFGVVEKQNLITNEMMPVWFIFEPKCLLHIS